MLSARIYVNYVVCVGEVLVVGRGAVKIWFLGQVCVPA